MISRISPRASRSAAQDSATNRLLQGELLDLYAAVLIIVPLAVFLRFL